MKSFKTVQMKIIPGVFQIGGEGYTNMQDAAIYLIKTGDEAAIVDAGCGPSGKQLLENIEACGVSREQVTYLLLTHCHFDHTGGGKFLRDSLGCKTVAHELDAVYIETGDNEVSAAGWYRKTLSPFPIDIRLAGDSEKIPLGDTCIEAIHIPGHSPGSAAYLFETDGKRILFGQDVHGPLHPSLKSVRTDYEQSLQKLIDLQADILCEGHYGVFHDRETVAGFIRSFI